MEIESLKLDFHVDFFPHQTYPLTNRDLKTRVLDTRDASFQHCFEMWQLTKFFIYLLLFEKGVPRLKHHFLRMKIIYNITIFLWISLGEQFFYN